MFLPTCCSSSLTSSISSSGSSMVSSLMSSFISTSLSLTSGYLSSSGFSSLFFSRHFGVKKRRNLFIHDFPFFFSISSSFSKQLIWSSLLFSPWMTCCSSFSAWRALSGFCRAKVASLWSYLVLHTILLSLWGHSLEWMGFLNELLNHLR